MHSDVSFQQILVVSRELERLWVHPDGKQDRRKHLIIPQPGHFFSTNFESANEAIGIILVLALEQKMSPQLREEHFFEIKESIANTAYHNRYSGNWEISQNLLEVPTSINHITAVLLKYYSPEDIFGNILPLAGRLLRRIRSKKPYNPLTDSRKVEKKIFRRGYDDKGSLRPATKWLPSSYPELELPRPVDRRHKIHSFTPEIVRNVKRTFPIGLIPNLTSEEESQNEPEAWSINNTA